MWLRRWTIVCHPYVSRRNLTLTDDMIIDTQIFAPSQTPVYLAMGVVNPFLVWTLPLSMQNANLFHGVMSLMQVFVQRKGNHERKPSKEVWFHRSRAVTELRRSLERTSGVADDAAIMTTAALAVLDVSPQSRT